MEDQKAENLLNLALSVPEEMRERTEELNVGFNRKERTWEIIVKYHGDLGSALNAKFPDASGTYLFNDFAILRVPERDVPGVIALPEIEYAEKPKRLFFALNRARAASCFLPVQTGTDGLTGKGVLVAVIDSGIDIFHEDFRNEDGTTRILYLDDQISGKTYERREINEILRGENKSGGTGGRSLDTSGHGTAVAGVAAGNGRTSGGLYRGAAYESELIIVRLGIPDSVGFPRTTELMRGMDLAVRKALELGRPMAVNLSFGNTYGSHDGTSLLETYLNSMAERGRTSIIVGTGNEGYSMGHRAGFLQMGRPVEIELAVGEYQTGFGVQLWKLYQDRFSVEIFSPGGSSTGVIRESLGAQRLSYETEEILLYYGMPSPYSQAQEIYLDLIPKGSYIQDGLWKIRLIPEEIRDGQYDLWLPAGMALNRETRFLAASPDTTLTIPSTASRAISVGAYDDATQAYADFSGRGFARLGHPIKPELAAPGVNIITARAGGGYEAVTGTSFAAPFVTGSAALMMQWGIVNGNDPYLYGEKLKAYLIRGARSLPGEAVYPNERVGYGALCLERSFPL